jgi:hypothetical protein
MFFLAFGVAQPHSLPGTGSMDFYSLPGTGISGFHSLPGTGSMDSIVFLGPDRWTGSVGSVGLSLIFNMYGLN